MQKNFKIYKNQDLQEYLNQTANISDIILEKPQESEGKTHGRNALMDALYLPLLERNAGIARNELEGRCTEIFTALAAKIDVNSFQRTEFAPNSTSQLIDNNGNSLIKYAVYCGTGCFDLVDKFVRKILEDVPDFYKELTLQKQWTAISTQQYSTISAAASSGNPDIFNRVVEFYEKNVRDLLKAHLEILNQAGSSMLMRAADSGNPDMFNLVVELYKKHAPALLKTHLETLNKDGFSVLMSAAISGNPELFVKACEISYGLKPEDLQKQLKSQNCRVIAEGLMMENEEALTNLAQLYYKAYKDHSKIRDSSTEENIIGQFLCDSKQINASKERESVDQKTIGKFRAALAELIEPAQDTKPHKHKKGNLFRRGFRDDEDGDDDIHHTPHKHKKGSSFRRGFRDDEDGDIYNSHQRF